MADLLHDQRVVFAAGLSALTLMYTAIGYILDPARGKYGRSTVVNNPSAIVVLLAVAAALYAIPATQSDAYNDIVCASPTACQPSAAKPYTDFSDFYNTRYVAEHQVPEDRAMHVVIFVATMGLVVGRPGLLVTWCAMMTAGALATKPLLSLDVPLLEAAVMFAVAAAVAVRYDQHGSFFLIASLWMLADLASHIWLGQNGDVAMYIGEHYLAWGLWGQVRLVLGIIADGGI